jgi:hypothetical protein
VDDVVRLRLREKWIDISLWGGWCVCFGYAETYTPPTRGDKEKPVADCFVKPLEDPIYQPKTWN